MTEAPIRVLLVDDDCSILEGLGDYLELEGLTTLRYADGTRLLDEIDTIRADVALVDIRMPKVDGLSLLPQLHEDLKIPVIMLTGYGDIETAVQAIRLGAYDFQTKPAPPERLLRLIQRAVEHERLRQENERLKRSLGDHPAFEGLIGTSAVIRRVIDLARTIAEADGSVMLRGETGTGKELLARAIHRASQRADGPFVALNCAAMNAQLLESAMFGHERGSFTGADHLRSGHLEHADGGTLFLDEVGSMPLEVQAKLLRVLESRRFRRMGSSREQEVDIRILSATNHDLREAIAQGRFRQDLFYRLDVLPIFLPPLRRRQGDIPLLAMHFLREASSRMGKGVSDLSPSALLRLEAHDWPGNVRELKNVIERAVVFSSTATVEVLDIGSSDESLPSPIRPLDGAESAPFPRDRCQFEDLPSQGASQGTLPPSRVFTDTLPVFAEARDRVLGEFERAYLEKVLRRSLGNLRLAAKISGMSYKTLQRKLQLHEIDRKTFRP